MQPQGGCRRQRGQAHQLLAQAVEAGADQGQAFQYGCLAALVFVGGADLGPLDVIEEGQVVGAGHVALAKLAGAAHIDHRSLAVQKCLNCKPHLLGWLGHPALGLA